jgi:hypothetical protein
MELDVQGLFPGSGTAIPAHRNFVGWISADLRAGGGGDKSPGRLSH